MVAILAIIVFISQSVIMQNTIKHIIWDWNGTLYDDPHVCVEALNTILEKRNLPLVDIDQYREIFRFPVRAYYEEIGFDFETDDWDGMAREFHEIYGKVREADHTSLRAGVKEALTELKKRGIPMSVLSAAETTMLNHDLEQSNIRNFFSHACGTSDIYAGSKTDSGHQLIAELGLNPSEILLVGDTTHDHEVALELGCQCVLLTGGHQAEHRLQKCGRKIILDPIEVTALC
jgi:phosphoglycolate phosphatase